MANKDEISEGVLYLADNCRSSYVTGHNLIIDGGFDKLVMSSQFYIIGSGISGLVLAYELA